MKDIWGLISHSLGGMGALVGGRAGGPGARGAGGFPGAQVSAFPPSTAGLVTAEGPSALRVCDSKLLKWGHWPGDPNPAEEGASSKSCLPARHLVSPASPSPARTSLVPSGP